MGRWLPPLGLLLGAAVYFTTASATNPPGAPADHFLSYKTKTPKGAAAFVPIVGVALTDRFEGRFFDVTNVRELLVPASANGEAVADAAIHLQAYAIKATTVCTDDGRPCSKAAPCNPGAKCKRPASVKHLGQAMRDRFGARVVDAMKPDVLLVPSLKSLTGTPPAPVPATHHVDHFKCYKAKLAKGSAGLPKGTRVAISDQLTTPAKVFDLSALTHLCTPVDKNGEGIENPAGHLLCYKAKPAKGEPKHQKRTGVGVNNQLGPLTRDTVVEIALCVPAAPDGIVPTPSAQPTQATPAASATTTPIVGPTPSPTASAPPGIPPDPSSVAPAVEEGVATTVFDATEFLYDGSAPIQTGVVPGTIDLVRAAVVRGRVLDKESAALPGVTIRIVGHPELGQTLSRTDGAFDLAVNGGGLLTVSYEKAGLLPVQRQVVAPLQDFVQVPDVILIALDPQMTTIDLDVGAMQVARGSVMTDDDGTRQATLLFSAGMTANMVMPDGSSHPLTTLSVRATEYTVGPNGPKAMPGELPPSSGYTYAVELSADEAIAAGATSVTFDQPVIDYVENFLGFPVGTIVPTAFYDRDRAAWVPSTNGRVIKITGVTGDLADVDTVGTSGHIPLTLSTAEREQLAALYSVGQELWRVPITHFSSRDHNWPFGPPLDAASPNLKPKKGGDPDDDCDEDGSIIQCLSQALADEVPITGTAFKLRYDSSRASGRKAAFTLDFPVSGAQVPASLRRIDADISIAGRRIAESFPAAPNQNASFTWDGKDAYGRTVNGAALATVTIGFVYGALYQTPAEADESFGRLGGVPLVANQTRQEITLPQEISRFLGVLPAAVSGWSFSPHHSYDPVAKKLFLGNGTRRDADAIAAVITTVAGTGSSIFGGDGGPATKAPLGAPRGVAVAPDGSVYIADTNNQRIRRVATDGTITTVAGTGAQGFTGDDGPATDAKLFNPSSVALGPDDSVYFADQSNHRVRRVGPDGIITTVAGTTQGFSGDDGPATQAKLNNPVSVAVAPDGSVYIADGVNLRVRRVGPDGIITTVAGNGNVGFSGNGGPATQATVAPQGIALAPDGTLYIVDGTGPRIRRVGSDGIITVVAGSGNFGFSGDGGPAKQARFDQPHGIAVAPDGSLYVADRNNFRIRRITPDGIITTVVGSQPPPFGFSGEGAPATQAHLNLPFDVTVAPDGNLYVADTDDNRIRRVASPLPEFAVSEYAIPSDDGSQLYRFDSRGRHLQTLNVLTGTVRYAFSYDSAGRLTGVTDGDGNVTTIERDANGDPSAIVAPGGPRTSLAVDANGYLSTITDPAGKAIQFAYTGDGLLTTKTDARGGVHSFTYDALGRLVHDEDPAGGTKTLSRVETTDGFEVTLTTGLGRTSTYTLETLATDEVRRVNSDRAGAPTTVLTAPNGIETLTAPDGTVTTIKRGPDPRFGMLAPVATSVTHTAPGGRTLTQTGQRTVTLADPNDPLTLQALTDTVTINGRTFTGSYNAATRTMTTTSAAGRQHTAVVDLQGRVVSKKLAAELAAITTSYDTLGRVTHVAQGEEALTYAYDAANRVVSRTDAANQSTSYGYDAADRVTEVTLPSGRAFGFGYDANGNRTTVAMPNAATHTLAYTPVDLEASYAPPGNAPYLRSYDADRALKKSTLPGNRVVDVSYDAAGRDIGFSYPEAAIVFEYAASDPTRRLKRMTRTPVTIGSDQEVAFTYDGQQVTAATWTGAADGEFSYVYDNNFFLTSMQLVSGTDTVKTAFAHDGDGFITGYGPFTLTRGGPGGALSQISAGNFAADLAYDTLGRVTTRHQAIGGQQTFQLQLTHDSVGRVVHTVETVGAATHTYDYTYDDDGRLTDVARDSTAVEHYTYDPNGNRVSRTLGGNPAEPASYDAQDRLIQQGTVAYGFDVDGFLTQRGTDTFLYSARGELLNATVGGNTIDYSYDGVGRRVGRSSSDGDTQYFYGDSGNAFLLTNVRDPAGVLTTLFYDEAGLLFALERDGARFFVATDQVGTPRLVTDSAGQAVKVVRFDSFGNVISDSDPSFDLPIGFAGGLADAKTRLVRFGVRDYDPVAGRWTARDPLRFNAGQGNLFGYVGNDPVNRRDPLGLFCIGGSAYLLIGGGAEICYDDGDFSVCGELGIGVGASGSLGIGSGGVADNGSDLFVEASAKCGSAGIGARLSSDDSGCIEFKVKAELGPLAAQGGKIKAKQKLKVSESASSPTCGAQAKAGFKVCGGTK